MALLTETKLYWTSWINNLQTEWNYGSYWHQIGWSGFNVSCLVLTFTYSISIRRCIYTRVSMNIGVMSRWVLKPMHAQRSVLGHSSKLDSLRCDLPTAGGNEERLVVFNRDINEEMSVVRGGQPVSRRSHWPVSNGRGGRSSAQNARTFDRTVVAGCICSEIWPRKCLWCVSLINMWPMCKISFPWDLYSEVMWTKELQPLQFSYRPHFSLLFH